MNKLHAKPFRGAALLLLIFLAACAGAPPPRLMLLRNDVALPPASTAPRPLLVVRSVALAEYLDRRAIIYRSSDAELKRFPDVIWAERLGESLTQWISLQLAAGLPGYEVEALSARGDKSAGLSLNLEIQSLEPDATTGGTPVLHLRGAWHLSGAASADGRLAADVPMATLDAPSTVAAMRTALGQATDGIVRQVRQLPAGR